MLEYRRGPFSPPSAICSEHKAAIRNATSSHFQTKYKQGNIILNKSCWTPFSPDNLFVFSPKPDLPSPLFPSPPVLKCCPFEQHCIGSTFAKGTAFWWRHDVYPHFIAQFFRRPTRRQGQGTMTGRMPKSSAPNSHFWVTRADLSRRWRCADLPRCR